VMISVILVAGCGISFRCKRVHFSQDYLYCALQDFGHFSACGVCKRLLRFIFAFKLCE